jgi:translation initiation factor IF-1
MADDLDLPEWLEWALGKLSLGLILGGVAAFAVGVAALFGGLKPEFSPLYVLIGGPAAVVVGIGLYVRRIWAVLIALLLCLGATSVCGFALASGRGSGVPDPKSLVVGVFLVVWDLALLFLLVKVVAADKLAGLSEWVCEVKEIGPGLQCRVSLTDGERVVAVIPRHLARDLSWVVPGDLVRVTGPLRGGYRVLAFSRRRAEPGSAVDRPRGLVL